MYAKSAETSTITDMNQQDQIYIDSVQEQIKSGMYSGLFKTYDSPKRDLVFLDIGANVGLVSIYAAPFCRRIVAVEPSPMTYQTLVKNTPMNVECIRAALTPNDGPHEFFINDINFTASSTVNTYGQRIMVEGKTLRTILRENDLRHVDVCKIDAEGAEGEALTFEQFQGAFETIQTYYIETHNCPKTTWEHKLGTIVGNLARCGYHKMNINGMAVTASK